MTAYFQGRSYHYLTSSINCLWLGTERKTVRIQYEVTDLGLSMMEVSFYHPNYRPWEYMTGFSEAKPNEVATVLAEAMNGMEELKVATPRGVSLP